MLRWFWASVFSVNMLLASQAAATCQGRDLRPTMTPAATAALAQAAATTPFGQGNHWIATNGTQTIHVIGTLHVNDPRMADPVARLAPVIRSADHIFLEADRATQTELQTAIASRPDMILLSGTSLIDLMPEAQWQALATAARDRGIPSVMAARFQPWYLSMMLAMPPCLMPQLREQKGLDHQLMQIAEEAGISTGALEPFDTIFRIFGSEDLETQIEMMAINLIDAHMSESIFATLTALYFEENTAQIWELTRQTAQLPPERAAALLQELEHELLVKRNRAWIPVILSRPEAKTLVVAVGAAHLPGASGVLRLLEEAGYTLKRAAF